MLKDWAYRLKRDILALWLAGRDSRTPFAAKLLALTVAAYALSPIDLIPDFIPILGYVDDLILVPTGIWLALRLIPRPLMTEFRQQAAEMSDRPISRSAAAVIVAVWVMALTIPTIWLLVGRR